MTKSVDPLDKLCAEKIMGWDCTERTLSFFWNPTRDIKQAWDVLEKINYSGVQYYPESKEARVQTPGPNKLVDSDILVSQWGESAAHAIVKACLKAKGIDF